MNCCMYTKSGESPMHVVGMFLETVFSEHSLPNRCGVGLSQSSSFSQPSSPELSQLLHYCPGYSQAQLIHLIVSIYSGVPEAFEVFRCHPSSTKEELSLFLKRLARHPLKYLILGVNLLPFKLQEVCMLNYIGYHRTHSTCSYLLTSHSHPFPCFPQVSDAAAAGDSREGGTDFL